MMSFPRSTEVGRDPSRTLFDDDEHRVTDALQGNLRGLFDVCTENAFAVGLAILARLASFAVVVSDRSKPVTGGVEFLAKVKAFSLETIRIMLTGPTDTACGGGC